MSLTECSMLHLGYFLLLFFTLLLPICRAQEDCSVPPDPDNGYFKCMTEDGNLNCVLSCSSGFSSYPRSWISCSSTANWTLSPSSLMCSPSVMLLTGSSSATWITNVEILSLNLTCPNRRLPDLPVWNFGHTLDYVEGHIYMCGTDWYSTEDYTCWEMNEDKTWDVAPDRLTRPRGNHASSVVGSKLFLIGGDKDQTSSEVLDLQKSTGWMPGIELKEDTTEACAVTLSDGRVAVLGSWRSILGPLLPLLYKHDGAIIYNVEDGSVKHLPHMSVGRRNLGCTAFTKNGKEYILAVGGYEQESSIISPGVYWDTAEIYEVGSGIFGRWKTVSGTIPWAGAVNIEVIEEKIIAICADPNHGDHNAVLEYDIDEEMWISHGYTLGDHLAGGISPVPAAMFGCV